MITMDETRQYKIILVGDTSVGKTSILHRLVFNKFTEDYRSTVGADFLSKTIYQNDIIAQLQLWDTAGQEKFWCLTEVFWRTADAVILVYDISCEKSFQNLEFWYKQFKSKSVSEDGTEKSLPILVLGNKSDCQTRAVRQEDVEQWCKEKNIKLHFEVSAKFSNQIKESVSKLAEYITEGEKELENSHYDVYGEEEQYSSGLLKSGKKSVKLHSETNRSEDCSSFRCCK